MKALSASDLKALLAVARRHSEQDYLALLVGFNHGLRVSEILSLTRDNIVSGHLVIQRLKGSRKTTQPLLPSERDALLRLAATVEGPFFPMCRKTLWAHMKAYAAEAGVTTFVSPHWLKHTAGRLGFKGGMGVPELVAYLGHKNPANSLVYAAAGEQEAANAFVTAIEAGGL